VKPYVILIVTLGCGSKKASTDGAALSLSLSDMRVEQRDIEWTFESKAAIDAGCTAAREDEHGWITHATHVHDHGREACDTVYWDSTLGTSGDHFGKRYLRKRISRMATGGSTFASTTMV
jgi:hypothetical protein